MRLTVPIACGGPAAALRSLAALPAPFLLHSTLADARGRWSYFGADPFAIVRGGDHAAAMAAFRAHAAEAGDAADTPAPFAGGAVGYWAYDYGRRLERLPSVAADDLGLPDVMYALYDVIGAHDHASGETWLIASGLPERGAARRARAEQRIAAFAGRLAQRSGDAAQVGPRGGASARSTFDADGYRRAVERVRDHIARGDIFQANLSQRFTVPDRGPVLERALALHDAAARHTPAPFAAFLAHGDHAIVSASPERFLAVAASATRSYGPNRLHSVR